MEHLFYPDAPHPPSPAARVPFCVLSRRPRTAPLPTARPTPAFHHRHLFSRLYLKNRGHKFFRESGSSRPAWSGLSVQRSQPAAPPPPQPPSQPASRTEPAQPGSQPLARAIPASPWALGGPGPRQSSVAARAPPETHVRAARRYATPPPWYLPTSCNCRRRRRRCAARNLICEVSLLQLSAHSRLKMSVFARSLSFNPSRALSLLVMVPLRTTNPSSNGRETSQRSLVGNPY